MMMSLKSVIVFISFLTIVLCDEKKVGHHHHGHHHLFFHEFYYLIFLAIKAKIILFIGSIWAFGLVVAKTIAFFKISEYMKKSTHHDEHVVYVNPHDSYHHGPIEYGKNLDIGYPSSDVTFDHLPPSDEIQPAEYGPPNGYGRSVKKDTTTGIYKYFDLFEKFIKKYDITEMVFREMNIKSLDCKRKFVCEADYAANDNMILKNAFGLFSDSNYQKYRTNNTARAIEDCAALYPNCVGKT